MKNKFRFKSCAVYILVICMLLAMLPASYMATEADRVIPEDAIYLSSAEELVAFAENCRLNTWSVGKTVVLKNDIDLSGVEFAGIPTFGGIFMGQGHKITGMSLDREGSVVGFFRYIQEGAVVEKLTIEGEIIPTGSSSIAGGFAGENAGTIVNCVFSGKVSGKDQIGGFVGINKAEGVIEACTASGVIFGNHFVGGIAGENHGVVRSCTNHAKINAEAVQNSISIEDITMDNLVNTEYANTVTDIGGIAGISSGVLRECVNDGVVGYTSIGYNIGGIAGTQNGYLVDCVNYADIQGRKEVGGIVGQMEPNLALNFSEDSLQTLSEQLDELQVIINRFERQMDGNTEKLSEQIDALQSYITNAQNAVDALSNALNLDDSGENGENTTPDWDKTAAEMSDLADALNGILEETQNLIVTINTTMDDLNAGIDELSDQIDKIEQTINAAEDNLGVTVEDVSAQDTEEDTLGKVAGCINYGSVKGDFSVGGIAGLLAEENDLDEQQDVTISGEGSLNVSYQIRAVIRDCKNLGTVTVSKQAVGGIAGLMYLGCILESVNLGDVDAENADYVGGIVGDSYTTIRNSSAKCRISGDKYVGGIAGDGTVVTNCYAFVDIQKYSECGGAILGIVDELPGKTSDMDDIADNYFFTTDTSIGGIDGINYAGSAEYLPLEQFLQLEGLEESFLSVTVRFCVEGQEDVVVTLKPGDTLTMAQIPEVPARNGADGIWEGLDVNALGAVLFDQVYTASYNQYSTVIEADLEKQNGLSVLLAEGIFPSSTILTATDWLGTEPTVNDKTALAHWEVDISDEAAVKLHYLLPEGVDGEKVQLLVQDASGAWKEREVVVDGTYLIFDYENGAQGFALVEADNVNVVLLLGTVIALWAVAIILAAILFVRKAKSKK